MLCVTSSGFIDAVDIFNAISGIWSTAVLSVARADLAATSLPEHGVALFAGGTSAFCALQLVSCFWLC